MVVWPDLNRVIFFLNEQVHYLAMLLDASLSMDRQEPNIARSAFSQFNLVCQLRLLLQKADLISVTCAL